MLKDRDKQLPKVSLTTLVDIVDEVNLLLSPMIIAFAVIVYVDVSAAISTITIETAAADTSTTSLTIIY